LIDVSLDAGLRRSARHQSGLLTYQKFRSLPQNDYECRRIQAAAALFRPSRAASRETDG
jgi:hypothetical protein